MTGKSTLYLLPGLLCDEAVWQEQEKALAPFFDVRIPVFRGFDNLTDMARSVLQEAPPHFSVMGHSMGGRVAMELMQLAGDRIDKFGVMDTGMHPVRPGEDQKRQVLLDLANEKGLEAVAEAWIGPMVHPDRQNDTALIQEITQMILRNSVADFKGQIRALLGRSDQSRYLPNISQQVLLVCGDADGWSPVSQHEAMLDQLPHGHLEVIKDAGHMLPMEQPQALNDVLLNWLNDEAGERSKRIS